MVIQGRFDENLGLRQPVGGEIVIREGAGLIGVVEENHRPRAFDVSLGLTSFAGVPHTGITHRSTNACIAAIRASKSTPRGVDALLKHAMVGTPPWLNAPNVGLAALIRPPWEMPREMGRDAAPRKKDRQARERARMATEHLRRETPDERVGRTRQCRVGQAARAGVR